MIRVEMLPDQRMALVTSEPSSFGRWLGAAPDVRIAVAVPAPSGGREWLWDATSRRICEPGIVSALERIARSLARPRHLDISLGVTWVRVGPVRSLFRRIFGS